MPNDRFDLNPRRLAWLLVALAACLTFAPALGADWLWDDHFFFDPLAPSLRSPLHVFEVFTRDLFSASTLGQRQDTYRPLTVWAWTWVVAFTGGKAWALHAWSLLLHAGGSVLVLELALAMGAPLRAATLAGVAFAASTAQAEAAVWISAVHGVAETGFVLGAALAALRLRGIRQGTVVVVCSIGALFCKESGVLAAMTGVAFAAAVAWREAPSDPKWWRGPVALAGALAAVLLAYLMWRARLELPVGRPPFSAAGVLSLAGLLGQSLLLPAWPDVCRPLMPLTAALPGVAVLLAISVLALWYSHARLLVWVALGLALATLLLLGPIAAQTTIASDRYLYLPQALLWAGVATALPDWNSTGLAPRGRLALAVTGLWLVLRAALGYLSVVDLADDVAAFAHSVAEHPENPETHYHLGVALLRVQRIDAAVAALEQGLQLRPNDPRMWSNLTGILINAHREEQAVALIPRFEAILPPSAKAAYNLGLAAQRRGDQGTATRLGLRALALDPNYAHAKVLLAPAP